MALCLAAHCHVKEGHFSVAAAQSGQVGGNKRMAMEVQGGPSTMTADLHAVKFLFGNEVSPHISLDKSV